MLAGKNLNFCAKQASKNSSALYCTDCSTYLSFSLFHSGLDKSLTCAEFDSIGY